MIIATERDFWLEAARRPLDARHGPAPQDLLDLVEQVNLGAPARAAAVDAPFTADVIAALAGLPPIVRDALRDNFVGVYFAHGLGSSAITDIVVGTDGEFLGIAIALDVDAVGERKANAWATWRENTPFQPGPWRVEVRIAEPDDDLRQNAIQFLLLHEIGHVLAAGRAFVPDWWLMPEQIGKTEDYSFLPLSWTINDAGQVLPLPHNAYAQRQRLAYYGTPRLASDEMLPAYRALLDSGFFTLYSSLSADEDFSESFALYVHTELLQKPYFVRIYEGNKLLLQYASEWSEPRFAGKRNLLRHILPGAGSLVQADQPDLAEQDMAHITEQAAAAGFPSAAQAYAPLIGVAPLMRRAFLKLDMAPLAAALLARATAHPQDANAFLDCSTVLQLTGDHDVALAVQAEAVRIQPRYQLPVKNGEPALRLLVIMGLGDLMSNTPIEFLLEGGDVALELLYLTEEAPWPEQLPEHDVLMVGLAESDRNQPLLHRLADYLAQWQQPVLNLPQRIAVLSRDGACAALAGIPQLEMPRTVRADRAQLAALADGSATLAALLPEADFPIIVRPTGSHAGHDLEKIETPAGLAAYLAHVDAQRFYVARFVDYRSSDGMFRKYRVVLVAGRPYICHYAISAHWMIHYLNAGMDQSADKRAEEAQCMAGFDQGFAARHAQALADIDRRIGLPYLGIDCAETPDGRLLIFEIDNAMIVHAMDDEQMYAYKKPVMARIFRAFRELLDTMRVKR